MTELEKEEAKLKEIVNELHEVMKEYRYAVIEENADLAEELYRKTQVLGEARAKQRRLVYKLRKEAGRNE